MNIPRHILVVDDDADLRRLVADYLGDYDLRVTGAADGAAMRDAMANEVVDLILLDLKLPSEDGMNLARELRETSSVPIIILTGRKDDVDRIMSLELGADDYLTKPFDLPELEARVRALIRRGQSGGSSFLTHGPLVLDTSGRRAILNGAPLELSAREIGVLEVLLLRSGRVVNKEQLAGQLYGWDEEVGANAIEVYVHRLRKKVEPAGVKIRTIRGLGYLLEKDT
jgi:two-component system OmpR family response regulator